MSDDNTDLYENELQELSLWHSWEQSFTDPILVVDEVEYFEIL